MLLRDAFFFLVVFRVMGVPVTQHTSLLVKMNAPLEDGNSTVLSKIFF